MTKMTIVFSILLVISCVVVVDDSMLQKNTTPQIESLHVDLVLGVDNEDFDVQLFKLTPDTNRYHSGLYISANELMRSSQVPCRSYSEVDSVVLENPFSPSTDIRFELPTPQEVRFLFTDITARVESEGDTLFTNSLDSGRYFLRFRKIYTSGGIFEFEFQSEKDTCALKTLLLK